MAKVTSKGEAKPRKKEVAPTEQVEKVLEGTTEKVDNIDDGEQLPNQSVPPVKSQRPKFEALKERIRERKAKRNG